MKTAREQGSTGFKEDEVLGEGKHMSQHRHWSLR